MFFAQHLEIAGEHCIPFYFKPGCGLKT